MNGNSKLRALGAVAVVAALVLAHLLGVTRSLGAPEQLVGAHELAAWAGHVLGITGTLAAVLAFSRGDYLRKVWTFTAAAALLLAAGTVMQSGWTHANPGVPFRESALLPYRSATVVGANLATVCALTLLALTYKRSGLQPPAVWKTRALQGVCVVAALLFVLPMVVVDVGRLRGGLVEVCAAAINLSSTFGDLATILLVIPILRVAFMLRGGRLAWVWWVTGLAGMVWLAHDMGEPLSRLLPGDPARNLELLEVLRTTGLSLVGLSGWLQRTAITSQPAPAPAPVLQVS